ncbi:MAG: PAS domain-containing protein [Paludibacterium sp.]|nr:PAS domain-containing protein [Paludibacterium sp.]MBV8646562.1 PAS domain-containing protein [Paludibacterium sp.]
MKKNQPTEIQQYLLSHYSHIADSIAKLFFPYAEVVIHDLDSQRVLYFANNLSRRVVGDDSALEHIERTITKKFVGPYEKINWDGRRMRSVSSVLFDEQGVARGLMCINFNIAVFSDMQSMLSLFITGAGMVEQPTELFHDYWQERINTFIHGWLQNRQLALNTLERQHRKELVEALYAEGAFNGKSATNYIANVLSLGRATVYKYLQSLKTKDA